MKLLVGIDMNIIFSPNVLANIQFAWTVRATNCSNRHIYPGPGALLFSLLSGCL